MKTGAIMIAAERRRQIDDEKWDAVHDDMHDEGEMAIAAACYAAPELRDRWGDDPWPWSTGYDKREKHGRVRQLVIAGALIAAEIDRLLRIEKRNRRAGNHGN